MGSFQKVKFGGSSLSCALILLYHASMFHVAVMMAFGDRDSYFPCLLFYLPALQFFLFNDILVYGNIVIDKKKVSLYSQHQNIGLACYTLTKCSNW